MASGGGGGSGWNVSHSYGYSYGYSKRYSAHYSSEGCDCCDCCNSRCFKCVCLLLPALICFSILSIIIISVSLTTIPRGRVSPIFSPGDTRILSYASFFCAGVTLTDQSTRVGSSLYLITDAPPLTDQNNFTIVRNELLIADDDYRYWSYYLYPNSEFTLELFTLPDSAGGVFYLIRGTATFNEWIKDPTTDLAIGFFSIGSLPYSDPKHRFSFQAKYEDDYYFVYFNNNLYPNRPFLRLNLTMSFYRFQYSTEDLDSFANCSVATTGECTVTVPYGSNYRALIVTDIPESPDWEENVDVNWRCVDRGWAFAIVILVPMAVVAICIGTMCLLMFCRLVKKGFFQYSDEEELPPAEPTATSKEEPVDETKSPELPAPEPTATSEEDDFKSVDPS